MPSFAIIIPCYNEEKRLNKKAFTQFIQLHQDVNVFFVNDGSIDKTNEVIAEIMQSQHNIELVDLTANFGKGEAVRQGILSALKDNSFNYIGYLDADLSTSLQEFYDLYNHAVDQDADFIFGSRIKKLGSVITRSFFRHTLGRAIATLVDKKFKLGYYDTQCGAKIFKSSLLEHLIQKPFVTKWFFDIEIFLRLKKKDRSYFGIEYPLKSWQNIKGSKIAVRSFTSVFKEIFVLFSKY